MNTGKFFALEGLDGSGKTTLIDRLRVEFPKLLYTREPGGSVFGEKIRKVLLDPESKDVPALPFLLAFMSARASHFHEIIIPALKQGRTVVSDRFDGSTFAFQLYGQENLEDLEDMFWYLHLEILQTEEGRLFRPHYLYLRILPEVSTERRLTRLAALGTENHFDSQTTGYHERVFAGYEEFFDRIASLARQPISPSENSPCIIDASRSIEEVYGDVKSVILGSA